MNDCPDETRVGDFLEGRLTPTDEAVLDEHIDVCASCRELAANLCRLQSAQSLEATPFDPYADLMSGSHAGRYSILKLIGRGSMGTVYEAYDPKLDRKIALKTVYAGAQYSQQVLTTRLGQEARALAKLSHSNVISVFDVGELNNGQLFIAMELVDGVSLRQWATRRARTSWWSVRDIALAAGRGLVAAHSAHLIHRDFKPDNVLVGRNGDVRVTDFGLVKSIEAPRNRAPDQAATTQVFSSRSTALNGTPAYMSPEQLRGEPASSASDQFSYCVTLFELLTGKRPFLGSTAEQMIGAIERANLGPLATAKAPMAVKAAIRRGLAANPAERFATMSELLSALAAPKPRLMRRLATWAIVALTGLAAGAAIVTWHDLQGSVCAEGQQRAQTVWNVQRQESLATQFLSLGVIGEKQFRTVSTLVDQWVATWQTRYDSNCDEIKMRRTQPPSTFARRLACYEQRLAEMNGALDVLAGTNLLSLVRSADVILGQPPLETCDKQPEEPNDLQNQSPALIAQVRTLDARLASASSLYDASRFTEAAKVAGQVRDEAQSLPSPRHAVRALLLLGKISASSSNENAITLLREVWSTALIAQDDRAAATAASFLSAVLAEHGQFKDSEEWLWHAETLIHRLNGDLDLERLVADRAGYVAFLRHDFEMAIQRGRRALELSQQLYGPSSIQAADSEASLGMAYTAVYRFDDAQWRHRHALTVAEPLVGVGNHRISMLRISLAEDLMNLAHPAEAFDVLQPALEPVTATLGEDSRQVAQMREFTAVILAQLGRADEALVLADKALKTFQTKKLVRNIAYAMTTKAMALMAARRFSDGRAQMREARAFIVTTFGPHDPDIAQTFQAEGDALLQGGFYRDALEAFHQALKKPGGDWMTGQIKLAMGKSFLALRNIKDSRAALQGALAMLEKYPNSTSLDEAKRLLRDAFEH